MVSTEQTRERRHSMRKWLMNGIFALAVVGGVYFFFASNNTAPETQDLASQQIELPSVTPEPQITPPD